MSLIIPVEPYVDESLATFVVRATARNHLRGPLSALQETGIKTVRLGSLCSRSPSLARPIAVWAGTQNVETVARMFHQPIDGRRGGSIGSGNRCEPSIGSPKKDVSRRRR